MKNSLRDTKVSVPFSSGLSSSSAKFLKSRNSLTQVLGEIFMRVLVIEDEEDISELLEFNLKREGYEVELVANGEEALDRVLNFKPDLILLDLMLPGIGGVEVCRRIRSGESTQKIPIIMLTARGSEADKVLGFEAGADDYVVKPFSPLELMARIRAIVRRLSEGSLATGELLDGPSSLLIKTMKFGNLEISIEEHWVRLNSEVVNLTRTEFDLLYTMAGKPGRVFRREELLQQIGGGVVVGDRTIDVHIASLRKKIQGAEPQIETIRGVGYKFIF